MKKRRTREDKTTATYSYRYSGTASKRTFDYKESTSSSLFFYDPKLIAKDLLKTVVVSALILGVELVLYYYLH